MQIKSIIVASFLWVQSLAFSNVEKEFVQLIEGKFLYFCPNFMEDEECNAMMARAESSLVRSSLVDKESLNTVVDERRTSLGTFLFSHSHLEGLEKMRIAASCLTSLPKENAEPVQVLKYVKGSEYKPHYDFFDLSSKGGALHAKRGGQRVATLLVYLKEPMSGGETYFPYLGVKIRPKKGAAAFFFHLDDKGEVNNETLHGSSPVIEGEKWIATLWIREKAY